MRSASTGCRSSRGLCWRRHAQHIACHGCDWSFNGKRAFVRGMAHSKLHTGRVNRVSPSSLRIGFFWAIEPLRDPIPPAARLRGVAGLHGERGLTPHVPAVLTLVGLDFRTVGNHHPAGGRMTARADRREERHGFGSPWRCGGAVNLTARDSHWGRRIPANGMTSTVSQPCEEMSIRYSLLNATMGSTLVARRAGT